MLPMLIDTEIAEIRREFPTLENWTHFALAHKAPLPRCAEDAIASFLRDFQENAGKYAFDMERCEETRTSLAALVGAPARTLAFVKNTSEGINILASGLGLGEGDEVIVSDLEHEANLLPWRRLAERGVTITIASGGAPDLIQRLSARTRVVAVSWVTYGTGYRFDLPALGRACRERDALLVVDGIQGVGVLATPLVALEADAIACGGHKGLLGLAGAGFLYVREDVIPRVEPPYAAKFSFTSPNKWDETLELAAGAHRFEYGNPNHLGLAVLKRSSEFLRDLGLDNIEARVKKLTTELLECARAAGLEVATSDAWEERAGIVSFEMSHAAEIQACLEERKILASVKDDRLLRVACHFFNTEEEVERLVKAIVSCV